MITPQIRQAEEDRIAAMKRLLQAVQEAFPIGATVRQTIRHGVTITATVIDHPFSYRAAGEIRIKNQATGVDRWVDVRSSVHPTQRI